MFQRGKTRDLAVATTYRSDGRIVIKGLAPMKSPMKGAATTSDLLAIVEQDAEDLTLGGELLRVLDSYGKRPQADQQKELLKAFGVSSRTRLIRAASCVSVELLREYDQVQFSPWRKHPPGGWYGDIYDPVFTCPSANTVGLGSLLRKAFDVADDFSTG